jgi:NitT/TauT family transport system ATP-binding protein
MPDSGSIHISKSEVFANGTAFIFQNPTLLPWRTVGENVELPLEAMRVPRVHRNRRVADVLQRVNLSEYSAWYPKNLSGGMLQRTSIARALVGRPAMLLMDEPLASLDVLTRDVLLTDLVRIWGATPYTGLYVTHDPSEAVRIGHRVVVLTARPGRIREVIPIDVPIDKRSESHPTIVAARDRIWDLIRNPE